MYTNIFCCCSDTYSGFFYDGHVYHKEKPRTKNVGQQRFHYCRCEKRNPGQSQRSPCSGLITRNLITGVLTLKKEHIPHERYHSEYSLETIFEKELAEHIRTDAREFQEIFESLKAR